MRDFRLKNRGRVFCSILLLGIGVSVPRIGRGQSAMTNMPAKAKVGRSSLTTAYEPCTSPNTSTEWPIPVPACTATRSDPICGFGEGAGSAGSGKFTASLSANGNLKLSVTATHLGRDCEGHLLCATAAVRTTTDQCLDPPCTTVDISDAIAASPTACCQVTVGVCRIKTSINQESFGTLAPGQRTGIEILGCGLRRTTGPSHPVAPSKSFVCGLLAP
jgi:hypothetical protein